MENQLEVNTGSPAINPDQMIMSAIENKLDMNQLEKFLDLKDRWEKKEAEKKYNQAMAVVQKEIGAVKAKLHNRQTGSKYAGIVDIDAAIRPSYTSNGLAISFDTADSPQQEHVRILAHITHQDGHKETRHIDIPADGKGAKGGDVMTKTHAVMSATTYGQRALLKMIFNIASGEFDDDGNKASPQKEQKFKKDQSSESVDALHKEYMALLEEYKTKSKTDGKELDPDNWKTERNLGAYKYAIRTIKQKINGLN